MILPLESIPKKELLYSSDKNNREIYIYKLDNVQNAGTNVLYSEKFYNPVNEFTLSLNTKIIGEIDRNFIPIIKNDNDNISVTEDDYFYFIYNQDNYYHYLYDTLPYLISYLHLKNINPKIKLLMKKPKFRFINEFLELLNINTEDIVIISDDIIYKKLYISSSYTHSGLHDLPPRSEIYDLYRKLTDNVHEGKYIYDNIYISRRTWIQNDFSNIGTNYTIKRKLENEDKLVDLLISKGYKEIFTETLTAKDKIWLFKNVKFVVGSIGGGICNVLFSNPNCKLIAIISPTFLDINTRFLYSLINVRLQLITSTICTEQGMYKKYMRIKLKDNRIGEIIDYKNDDKNNFIITVQLAGLTTTGWIDGNKYEIIDIIDKDVEKKLDDGLNSSWIISDIESINFN